MTMTTNPAGMETIRYPLKTESKTQPKFPSVRYFQVHFEYLESQLTENRLVMETLEAKIADLTVRLTAMTGETGNRKEHS
jgi:hypothetical protein